MDSPESKKGLLPSDFKFIRLQPSDEVKEGTVDYAFRAPKARIAIIGATVAGLTCARELIEIGGQRVMLFDPRLDFQNDESAQSEIGNLCDDLGIALPSLGTGSRQTPFGYAISGKTLTRRQFNSIVRPMAQRIAEDYETILEGTDIDRITSLELRSASQYLCSLDLPVWAAQSLKERLLFDCGDLDSLTAFQAVMKLQGCSTRSEDAQKTYSAFQPKIGAAGHLHLGHQLSAIKRRDNCFELELKAGSAEVVYYADYVVLALTNSDSQEVDFDESGLSESRLALLTQRREESDNPVMILAENGEGKDAPSDTILIDDVHGLAADLWSSFGTDGRVVEGTVRTVFLSDLDVIEGEEQHFEYAYSNSHSEIRTAPAVDRTQQQALLAASAIAGNIMKRRDEFLVSSFSTNPSHSRRVA